MHCWLAVSTHASVRRAWLGCVALLLTLAPLRKPPSTQTKCIHNRYKSEDEFAADVRQIFVNCSTYNQPGSDIVMHAEALSELFERDFAMIKSKKRKREDNASDRTLSRQEKRKLCEDITKLTGEMLAGVVEIIQRRNIVPKDSMEIEVNVDELDNETVRELEQFVAQHA